MFLHALLKEKVRGDGVFPLEYFYFGSTWQHSPSLSFLPGFNLDSFSSLPFVKGRDEVEKPKVNLLVGLLQ